MTGNNLGGWVKHYAKGSVYKFSFKDDKVYMAEIGAEHLIIAQTKEDLEPIIKEAIKNAVFQPNAVCAD